MTPYSPLESTVILGEQVASIFVLCAGFLLRLYISPEDGDDVSQKGLLTFNGLHGVVAQKIVLFVTTVLGTSNSTILLYVLTE
jgi:uncharacterized membrane protein